MCMPATCPTCHNATWYGCGKHIATVMEQIKQQINAQNSTTSNSEISSDADGTKDSESKIQIGYQNDDQPTNSEQTEAADGGLKICDCEPKYKDQNGVEWPPKGVV